MAKPKPDTMEVVIEEDGTMTITSGPFSDEVHKDADEALEFIEEMLGSTRTTKHLPHQKSVSRRVRHIGKQQQIGRQL